MSKKVKSDKPKYVAVFSGVEDKAPNSVFTGADIVAVFGGVELDLRNVEITENVVINCKAIFGGIDLKLPDNVKVQATGFPVCGGIENKKEIDKKDGTPTLQIKYVCVFGGIDLT